MGRPSLSHHTLSCQLINRTFEKVLEQKKSGITIMSLGSGGCRELDLVYFANQDSISRIVLVDSNIDPARQKVNSLRLSEGANNKFFFVEANLNYNDSFTFLEEFQPDLVISSMVTSQLTLGIALTRSQALNLFYKPYVAKLADFCAKASAWLYYASTPFVLSPKNKNDTQELLLKDILSDHLNWLIPIFEKRGMVPYAHDDTKTHQLRLYEPTLHCYFCGEGHILAPKEAL